MKKFMKAIAFVTVMCLAFSTVAFAAGTPEIVTDKVLNITVTGANEDLVSLVVVDAEETDLSNPLYINQTAASGDTATFRAVLTNKDAKAVDIYVGYATHANAGYATPEKVVNDFAITKEITEVTISNVKCTWDNYQDKGMEQTATGAILSFEFEAPEGVVATQMVWKITYEGKDGNVDKYTDIFEIADTYGLGSVIESGSGVKLGLAFLNGSEKSKLPSVKIVDISAIFLFEGESFESQKVPAAKN